MHACAALRGGDRVTNQMREDFELVRSVLDAGPTRIGATETVLDPATGRPVDIRRPDFRPGPRFLATCLTIAGVLGAAHRFGLQGYENRILPVFGYNRFQFSPGQDHNNR